MKRPPLLATGARFSPDRTYRYVLWRIWDLSKPPAAFIGLNPSIAAEEIDDPTVRREMDFAFRWGHGGLIKLNAFAYCATDPKAMKAAADPVGPENLETIRRLPTTCIATLDKKIATQRPSRIVVCWGGHGLYRDQQQHVLNALIGVPIYCLGVNRDGTPVHPLYQRTDVVPQLFHPTTETPR